MSGKIVETEEGEKTYFGYSCPHNEGVSCNPNKHHCESCGWNPEVAKERLCRICFDLGIDVPEGCL